MRFNRVARRIPKVAIMNGRAFDKRSEAARKAVLARWAKRKQIVTHCASCGMELRVQVKAGEQIDDALPRIREAYDAHKCAKKTGVIQ